MKMLINLKFMYYRKLINRNFVSHQLRIEICSMIYNISLFNNMNYIYF